MKRDKPIRVLCLSPFFAPLANAEAYCGGKIALHLLDAGVDLTVFAVDYTGHAKFSRDSSPLWARLDPITISIPPHGHIPKILSAPLALRYHSPEWSRWIATTVRLAIRLHLERPFDIIYSRGLPNFAHIAAYWITRRIGQPWVANFNDPWDLEGANLMPQDRDKRKRTLALRISDFWLQRVMRSANVLTFPSVRLLEYHMRLGRPRGKCVVVPHIGHCASPATPCGLFKLVHAGNLGSGESTRRNATISLLHGLRTFLDHHAEASKVIRLVLAGPEDRPTLDLAHQLGLDPFVSCTGRLSYHESLQQMGSATVCILVEGNMPEGIYLPSKFPDYIHARKPVIALSPVIGTIADLQTNRGVMLVPVDDRHSIESAITKHYEAFVGGRLDSLQPGDEFVESYDGTRVSTQLCGIFEGLTATANLHK